MVRNAGGPAPERGLWFLRGEKTMLLTTKSTKDAKVSGKHLRNYPPFQGLSLCAGICQAAVLKLTIPQALNPRPGLSHASY